MKRIVLILAGILSITFVAQSVDLVPPLFTDYQPTGLFLERGGPANAPRLIRAGMVLPAASDRNPIELMRNDWVMIPGRDAGSGPAASVDGIGGTRLEPGTHIIATGPMEYTLLTGTVRVLRTGVDDGLVIRSGSLTISGDADAVIRRDFDEVRIRAGRGSLIVRRGDRVVQVIHGEAARTESPGEIGRSEGFEGREAVFPLSRETGTYAERYQAREDSFAEVYTRAVYSVVESGSLDDALREPLERAVLEYAPVYAYAESHALDWVRSPDLKRTYIAEALWMLILQKNVTDES